MPANSDLVDLQTTLYMSKNPTRRWLHCTRRDWIIAALKLSSAKSNGKALEVGPGSGVYLPSLAQLFDEVVASDVQPAFLDHARHLITNYPNLSLVIDDITMSYFPNNTFDLILCTEVIEHIPDSKAALREMHRIIKSGGTLILSTPQRYSPLELVAKIAFLPGVIKLVRLVYGEPVLETGHVNLMTSRTITRQLEAAGFIIKEHYKSGLYLPIVAEFTGSVGLKCEQWLESCLRGGPLAGLLWTQYYVTEAC